MVQADLFDCYHSLGNLSIDWRGLSDFKVTWKRVPQTASAYACACHGCGSKHLGDRVASSLGESAGCLWKTTVESGLYSMSNAGTAAGPGVCRIPSKNLLEEEMLTQSPQMGKSHHKAQPYCGYCSHVCGRSSWVWWL